MRFSDEIHEKAYAAMVQRMNAADDVYRLALAYLLTLDPVCKEHIEQIYDFDEKCIKLNCLSAGWQTGTSIKTTRLAFNLFTGHLYWCDEEDRVFVSPSEIFCCSYAPYYVEAMKLRKLF